jgi:hypothetical protein
VDYLSVLVNFDLVNNLRSVWDIFDIPELVPQFIMTLVETTINVHILSLLEMITAQT